MAKQTIRITVRTRVKKSTDSSISTKTCPSCHGTGKVRK